MKLLRTAAAVLAVLLMIPEAFAAGVSYTAVLGGRVDTVMSEGTAVGQGDILVTIESLTGPIPAARAAAAGVVEKTLVAPGAEVEQGDVLIIVQEP